GPSNPPPTPALAFKVRITESPGKTLSLTRPHSPGSTAPASRAAPMIPSIAATATRPTRTALGGSFIVPPPPSLYTAGEPAAPGSAIRCLRRDGIRTPRRALSRPLRAAARRRAWRGDRARDANGLVVEDLRAVLVLEAARGV